MVSESNQKLSELGINDYETPLQPHSLKAIENSVGSGNVELIKGSLYRVRINN